MHKDFLRVAALTPEITPANPQSNAENALFLIRKTGDNGLIVLPELCITGYTCGDLFLHAALLDAAEDALAGLLRETKASEALIAVGMPVRVRHRLYNCAVVMQGGKLLGVVPKSRICHYTQYTESRYFKSGAGCSGTITLCGEDVPFGTDLLFDAGDGCCAAFEICEDLWGGMSPAERYAAAGALVIGNLSASDAGAGKFEYRNDLIRVQSARLSAGYIYTSGGAGESTSGMVFSGCRVIAENGTILERSGIVENTGATVTELDMGLLAYERRRTSSDSGDIPNMRVIPARRGGTVFALTRTYSSEPFVPAENDVLATRCHEVMSMQVRGLRTRLNRLPGMKAIVAVSGGLDSTLALLAARQAAKQEQRKLLAVTMPGPGTTVRTRTNAEELCKALGIPIKTVPIDDALAGHLKDIGHSGRPDVVFENAQARERAQIIMDIANAENGIVIGSSDLSESALGFSTFGGDHMSMYNVNAGVPKTLIRHILRHVAVKSEKKLRTVLFDIIDTPISPELLPVDEHGTQDQRTEDILGDYLVHDFYLYWFVRYGYSREKLLLAANRAFEGRYMPESLESVLDVFLTRFKNAQFKRSCTPDGVRIGSVSLSRSDWLMPGDLVRLP